MIDEEIVDDYLEQFLLEHSGVKGMKWGVRKDRDSSGFRGQSSPTNIDPVLAASTKSAAQEVSSLISARYGFNITQVKNLQNDFPDEYKNGTIAFVQLTPGKREGVIYARSNDFRKDLKEAESTGFMAPGTTNPRGMLTHESAHAMFHANQQTKRGLMSNKVVGDYQSARDKALNAADKQYRLDGGQPGAFLNKVSGYAAYSRTREELEAEMFSQYHWGTNTPKFIQVWGQTLHQEMGVDSTPFKETVKHD